MLKLFVKRKINTVLICALILLLMDSLIAAENRFFNNASISHAQKQHLAVADVKVTNAEITFPDNAKVIDVKKQYGAVGDGVTDDTHAIQQALKSERNGDRLVYLPNGTYLVSNTLLWDSDSKRTILQGQSTDGTIIKLKSNATNFSDPQNPKPVVTTFEGKSTGQAFRNSIYNLTVDVGSGNPGAIGIRFISNNQGGIRDVTIRSNDGQGAVGLAMNKQWPGPSMIRNVHVIGFDYGIRAVCPEYSITFEQITLENQNIVGIYNVWNVLSIRGLTSKNAVPVIKNEGDNRSFIVVIDGNFTGGSAANIAIENNAGHLFARNITTSGYQAAIKDDSTVVSGTSVSEYVTHNLYSPSPQKSLNLAVEEVPTIPWDDFSNWASVEDYGANSTDERDDTTAIQTALDSGKTTVYFPKGSYKVSRTLRVRGNVRRIVGLESTLTVIAPLISQTKPVFRFEQGNQEVVVLERFSFGYGKSGYVWVENASPKTLVIRNIMASSGKAYRSTSGAGRLFIEDVTAGGWVFNRQQVWARQLNPENKDTKIINNGGVLWILGLKTEKVGTIVETKAGGKTEILGGLIYPGQQVSSKQPAFLSNNSSLSVSIAASCYASGEYYKIVVKETTDVMTKILNSTALPKRTECGFNLPLYSGS